VHYVAGRLAGWFGDCVGYVVFDELGGVWGLEADVDGSGAFVSEIITFEG
jgi:hypothetical protein